MVCPYVRVVTRTDNPLAMYKVRFISASPYAGASSVRFNSPKQLLRFVSRDSWPEIIRHTLAVDLGPDWEGNGRSRCWDKILGNHVGKVRSCLVSSWEGGYANCDGRAMVREGEVGPAIERNSFFFSRVTNGWKIIRAAPCGRGSSRTPRSAKC